MLSFKTVRARKSRVSRFEIGDLTRNQVAMILDGLRLYAGSLGSETAARLYMRLYDEFLETLKEIKKGKKHADSADGNPH